MQTPIARLLALLVLFGVPYGCAGGGEEPIPDGGGSDTGVDGVVDTQAVADSSDGGDTADVGDTSDETDTYERTQCGTLPSPPTDELCQVTSGSEDWVLLKGDVLTDGEIFENGSVLVDRTGSTGKIACTGCDCSSGTGGATPTTVACNEGVLSPGLINAHEHLGWATAGPYEGDESTRYDHRHEWRTGARMKPEISTPPSNFGREAILHGELRHLFGGSTSIAGSSRGTSPQGLLRNLDAFQATEGLDVGVEYATFPLGDLDGTLREDGCNYNDMASNGIAPYSVLENDIYLPHVSEGIDAAAQNEFDCLSTIGGQSRDLVEHNTSIVHGIGLSAEDVRELDAEGGNLVWSPRTNIALYGQTADVLTYRRAGVPVALGTDWSVSGSMNMLRELSCAARLNRNHYGEALTNRALWRMATVDGARALGVGDRVGRLREGYVADIALFDGRDRESFRAVVDAEASDVHMVMRGGTPLYADASITDETIDTNDTSQCSEVDVCGDARKVCAELDTADDADGAVDFQALRDAGSAESYPLFECNPDELEEPTCRPSRPDDYDGSTRDEDADGDGIPDDADNCPDVFNPSRPLEGSQPDADRDDRGDACDPCPTTGGTDCDLDDWDGDGTPDAEDNCPFTENTEQTDGDRDGIGAPCENSTTIYDIRNDNHSTGELVEIEDVVVTAVWEGDDPAVWVQVPTDAQRYQGAENSGMFVYLGTRSTPSRGDIIDIDGRVTDRFGRQQISQVRNIENESSENALPDPVVVDPCDVATGGPKASSLQGVLVRVEGVSVTDSNPDGPGDDFGEFSVGSCSGDAGLRIDDALHRPMPDPESGNEFDFIRGPLHYSFDNSKIEPRDDADVQVAPPDLDGFTPGTAYLKAGTSGVPKPSFEVVLTRAPSSSVTVSLNYPNASMVSGPSDVTIPAGSQRETVSLQAGQASSSKSDFAAVEASFGGTTESADILVYDDSFDRVVDSLSAQTTTLPTGTNFQVTATLDLPAPSGDQTLSLSTSSDLDLPSTPVAVAADTFETTFTVGSGSNGGQKTLTATADGGGASTSVSIQGACLIVSEYIEGSGSNNKALELYNCGSTTLNLSDYGICIAFNSSTSCDADATLSSTTLATGDVYGVCRSKTGTSGDPVAGVKNNCDEELSSVIKFNGNDRLRVFRDENGDGAYSSGSDTKMDQFGEISNPPSGDPWKDTTYRRCNLAPYLGQSSFLASDYYTSHPKGDASHYGTAPSNPSCP